MHLNSLTLSNNDVHWSIYCDGSADITGHSIGMGLFAISSFWKSESYMSYQDGSQLSSLQAEVLALEMAAKLAYEKGTSVSIYVDNKTVYEHFSGGKSIKNRGLLKHVTRELAHIWGCINALPNVEIKHTNDRIQPYMAMAHDLANRARNNRIHDFELTVDHLNGLRQTYLAQLFDSIVNELYAPGLQLLEGDLERLDAWLGYACFTDKPQNNLSQSLHTLTPEESQCLYSLIHARSIEQQKTHPRIMGRVTQLSVLLADDFEAVEAKPFTPSRVSHLNHEVGRSFVSQVCL